MYSSRSVRLQRRDSEENQSHFQCWSPRRNELESTNLAHWTEVLHRFSSRDAIIVVGSVLGKCFGGDYPRSRKRDHFQKLATGLPKVKTHLGTQRVNVPLHFHIAFSVIVARTIIVFDLTQQNVIITNFDETVINLEVIVHLIDAHACFFVITFLKM